VLRPLAHPHRRLAQTIASTAIAVNQKPLLGVLVAKAVEHPGRDRDRLAVEHLLQKRFDLGLDVSRCDNPMSAINALAE
jgi:hypothetical protein